MQSRYHEEEEKIQCALEEAERDTSGKVNIAALAKKHGVDEQRLRRRHKGKSSKITRPPANRKLTDKDGPGVGFGAGSPELRTYSARIRVRSVKNVERNACGAVRSSGKVSVIFLRSTEQPA